MSSPIGSSNPSTPVYSLNIPEVSGFTSEFFYNFYVTDESTNATSKLDPGAVSLLTPKDALRKNPEYTAFNLRVPRYVVLKWNAMPNDNTTPNPLLDGVLNNTPVASLVVGEDQFSSLKYYSFSFQSLNKIQNTHRLISTPSPNSDFSLSTNIDSYINDVLNSVNMANDGNTNQENLDKQIQKFVTGAEQLGDNPNETLGISFYDKDNKQIKYTSGFEQIFLNEVVINSKINALTIPNIFDTSGLSPSMQKALDEAYKDANNNVDQVNSFKFDPFLSITPVMIYPGSFNAGDVNKWTATFAPVGYIIDKYELTENNTKFIKIESFVINDPNSTSLTDAKVKYGSSYYYAIRSIYSIETPAYVSSNEVKKVKYYVSTDRPTTTHILSFENVPPPSPTELDFVWNYKTRELNVTWAMPPNSQRDIKQFQIFRRKTINDPFQLLKQQCFDKSDVRYLTGEIIDGNRTAMSPEEQKFVEIQEFPTMRYVDKEFYADIESFTSSKYIYALASVDAHGLISNYSAQFEVYFDFFQNKLIKKEISSAGAPRPYPNIDLDISVFKDVISVSGEASKKLKVYFTPEYFNIKPYPITYPDQSKTILTTTNPSSKQKGYYKLQIINIQNQKSDFLKISVEDPFGKTSAPNVS